MVNFKAMPCTLVLSVLMCGCAAFGTNTDSVKIAAEDSFLLDTYCRLTELNGDQNAVADAQTLIAEIDSSFQTAYEKNANTLSYLSFFLKLAFSENQRKINNKQVEFWRRHGSIRHHPNKNC